MARWRQQCRLIVVEADGDLDDLTIYARVVAEKVVTGPFLKIEEMGEELKRLVLVESLEANAVAKVGKQDGGRLLEVGLKPRVFVSLFFGRALERVRRAGLQSKAPEKVNATKGRFLFEEREPVADEALSGGIVISVLPRKVEAGHDAGVLIQA